MAKKHVVVEGRYVLRGLVRRRDQWAGRVRDITTGTVFQRTARAPKKEDAQREIMQYLRTLAREDYGEGERIIFSEAFEEWLGHRMVRPITLQTYRAIYQGGLRPHFGNLWTDQVTFRDVQDYISVRRDRKNKPTTIAIHLAMLRRFFVWAILMGYADDNPTRGIPLPSSRETRGQALTEEQARALLHSATGRGLLHLRIAVALYTGIRQKNLRGLTWSHIDLDAGRMSFDGHEMKNGRAHEVPIHPALARALRELRAKRPVVDLQKPFLGVNRVNLHYSFKGAVERAGLPDFRWHDLRHSFASLLSRRCSWACLQSLMGHSPRGVTIGYLHPTWEERVAAIGTLPDLLYQKAQIALDMRRAAE